MAWRPGTGALLASFLLLLLLTTAAPSADHGGGGGGEQLLPITLRLQDGGERVMVDSHGRQRAFHGTNCVVKGPPWIPSRDGFDQFTSLTARDFELMRSAGVNGIRLGVMWPGVEPERGQYNHSYLDIVADIVDEAATYGIYVLADMHEDALSERFCGEGIPEWASEPANSSAAFPLPLGPPYQNDPATGFPTRQDCANQSWTSYGGTEALASAYTRLYQNHDHLADSWGLQFAEVAKRLAAKPNLLGLELLNEPWSPPIGEHPPNRANRELLQPAYDIVATHIRAVAPEVLIFFSGAIGDRTGDPKIDAIPLGFDHPPGGDEHAAYSAIAFHSYLGQNLGSWPIPGLRAYYQTRIRDARNLSTGLLMTESGANITPFAFCCCDASIAASFPRETTIVYPDRLGTDRRKRWNPAMACLPAWRIIMQEASSCSSTCGLSWRS